MLNIAAVEASQSTVVGQEPGIYVLNKVKPIKLDGEADPYFGILPWSRNVIRQLNASLWVSLRKPNSSVQTANPPCYLRNSGSSSNPVTQCSPPRPDDPMARI